MVHRTRTERDEGVMGRPTTFAAIAAILACFVAGETAPAAAQGTEPQSWPELKCARYRKAWSDALAHRGTKGLGQEFIARHEAFLASGCTAKGDVCPRSAEELDLANMMVVAAMNAGMASTFPPFSCRK
ncbi:hypothetical protein [Microvirga sp. CF3016]|uniref:hypothetical protein n=1 Tax=Microvirga sp. CF3016 TaxID=3110181 RepID=UPI002E781EF2|nr:hypothetical protein [Microvirga sp. CF3016]MEE1610531.1 hypothetical protein [Microvirga sp. CF3016]